MNTQTHIHAAITASVHLIHSHTNEYARECIVSRQHIPYSCTHTHTHAHTCIAWQSVRLVHALTHASHSRNGSVGHKPCTSPNTHSNTCMHRLATTTYGYAPYSCTNKHTHASPRSNHREHAPYSSPNTHAHTPMHRLAAITVSMRLVEAKTRSPSHACIASQQSQ
jgi:hypothetical protein